MSSVDLEVLSSCLAFPGDFVITTLLPTPTHLVVHLSRQAATAACPLCHQLSERVHSRYGRTVADVPCGGRRVILRLSVRKFVCTIASCSRQIFTERLPDFVESYARMTNRLVAALQAIGLATGGEMGARLVDKMGIATTPQTVLCQVMKLPIDPHPTVRVLGLDDFAWKKGRRYGTLLVDLEARKIIDLLPDRACATVAKWLSKHPEIEIISRDRGTDYAAAAREAAPQARQIADRFHLVRNLADVLQPLLARCRTDHQRTDAPLSSEEECPPTDPPSLPHPDAWRQHASNQVERRYKANQDERDARYQRLAALRSQGLTMKTIGQCVGMSERSVRSWLKQGGAPIHRRRKKRASLFDPYAAFVLEQWQAGVQTNERIYEAIRARGFRGSLSIVRKFLQTLREDRRPIPHLEPPDPFAQCGGRHAVWLFIRKSQDLTTEEQTALASLRQASPLVETIYELVQDFLTMIRKRQGERLDTWLQAVQNSQIPELQRFAQGLVKDKEAVVAGLTEIYSNGPVEAQVHKLKLVKRQAFGRAKLPLLRQRLLHTL